MGEHRIGRRGFLLGAGAAGSTIVLSSGTARAASTRLPASVFGLGVASGDPLPHQVILWTRLVRNPLDAGTMPSYDVPVQWQVATDSRFTSIVRSGTARARARLAHSVHVDVAGLRSGHAYFYRFRAGGVISPVGRTRTAASAYTPTPRVRVGIVNCQDWQNGYWPAYYGLAEEDLDVVLHLGDYIYEYDPYVGAVRPHNPSQASGLDQLRTLRDYRARHALYKTDPALQRAHSAHPWVLTWDDHETENNYATLIDEIDDEAAKRQTIAQFRRQRAAAYQAYYEHMPIRPAYQLGSATYRIYRRLTFGDLLRVNVLDTRQYRTDQPGGFPSDFGAESAGASNRTGTLTGAEQEQWLRHGLTSTPTLWNAVANQTMMSRIRFPNPVAPTTTFSNLDQWDGYVPQRTRFLRFLHEAKVRNPVVLAGDIHSSWFSNLKLNFEDPASPTVASEFVATSISSDFPIAFDAPIKAANPVLNPHVVYFDGSKRGYLRCDLTRQRWRTDVRVVDTILSPVAPVRTNASYVVEAGRPGIHPT